MTKKESYFSDEDLLRLKEELSKPSFWKEFEERCKEFDKVIDEMNYIDPKIMNEPMTI